MTYWKLVCVSLEDRYLYDLLEVGVCVFRGQVIIRLTGSWCVCLYKTGIYMTYCSVVGRLLRAMVLLLSTAPGRGWTTPRSGR